MAFGWNAFAPMEKDGEVFYELRHEKSGAQLAWLRKREFSSQYDIDIRREKTWLFDSTKTKKLCR